MQRGKPQKERRTGRAAIAALASAVFLCTTGCSGAPSPAPAAPAPAVHSATPTASASAPRPARYQRSDDPLARSFDGESNPYLRRGLARLWVGVARVENGDGSDRLRAASEALEQAKGRAQSESDACAGQARAALRTENVTKQAYERRYLASVDLLGEQNIESRVLDAQVQALRDDIDELERAVKSCPDKWFAPE